MEEKKDKFKRFLVAATIIAVVAVISVPWYLRTRTEAHHNQCHNNLRQIDGSMCAATIALTIPEGGRIPMIEVTRYLKGGTLPTCPSGGTYTVPPVGQNPTCSYHGDLLKEQ